MHQSRALTLAIGPVALWISIGSARQAAGPAWQDSSKHDVRFVTVDEGVRLEVLDWGGAGRPVVLLTGSGHTAHVYDEFAPKLADCCHVYGITRRGFGRSTRPASGYADQRLADDVFRAIEEAKILKPVLVGHSMAGGEMTTVGRQHSERLAGLVYLDAIADLEKDYSNIRVPVLAMLEFPRFPESYRPKDDEERALIQQFLARGLVIYGRWIDKMKRSVADVRVVDVPGGGHYLFLTREADVLRELHTFLASLH